MSVVTGIVLCYSVMEDYVYITQQINRWLADNEQPHLVQLDEMMRLHKHPQMSVYGGGYKWFPDAEFLEFFATLQWKEKREVFLIFQPEHEPMQVIRPP